MVNSQGPIKLLLRTRLLLLIVCFELLLFAPDSFAQEPVTLPPLTITASANDAASREPAVASQLLRGMGRGAEADGLLAALLGRAEPGGEDEGRIETDRDSFTPATRPVERGRLILESAYSFLDNRNSPDTNSFPETLLRYGIMERLELRLGWNYEVGGGNDLVSNAEGAEGLEGSRLSRESRLYYGMKALLSRQAGWLPESSFLAQAFTPTQGKDTATLLATTYVFGWTLPERWKLDAAVRYGTGTEHHDDFNLWAPSTVLRVPLGERWNAHIEYFGVFSQGRAHDFVQQYVSPGVHYLITRDLEIGIRLGWGLNEQSSRFFTNVGFGYRF